MTSYGSLKTSLKNLNVKDAAKMVDLHLQSYTQKTRKEWKRILIILTRLKQMKLCSWGQRVKQDGGSREVDPADRDQDSGLSLKIPDSIVPEDNLTTTD